MLLVETTLSLRSRMILWYTFILPCSQSPSLASVRGSVYTTLGEKKQRSIHLGFVLPRIKPNVSLMLGKCSTAELHSHPKKQRCHTHTNVS